MPQWCQELGRLAESLDSTTRELVEAAGIEPASVDPCNSLKPLEDKDSRDAG